MKAVLEYHDISNLSDAATRADRLPELRQALERMGFKHAGFLEERVNNASAQFTAILRDKADAEFTSKFLANGHVTEIMASPGEVASVELERFFESQLLEFRTIFENGVIVETSIRPVRLPKPRDPIQPLRDVLEFKLIQKFTNWIIGNPQWATSHRPRAGYHLELMDNPTPQEIWTQHKRRVEDIAQKQHTRIPPQNDIRLIFAMAARRKQMAQFQERFAAWGEKIIFALLLLVIAVFFISSSSVLFGRGPNIPPEVGIMLGLSTFFIALLGIAWPTRISRGITSYLPGPRTQPLQNLLESVPSNSTTGETIFQREFEDFSEEAMMMTVSHNVNQLKEVLHKEDKSLLEQWIKRRRPARKRNLRQGLHIYQRYERLLYTEWKLLGQPAEPKEQWGRFVFKMITGTTIGTLLGVTLRQIISIRGWNEEIFIVSIICVGIGVVIFDEFFGYLVLITLYMSYIISLLDVWAGVSSGIVFALIWCFFIKRRRFRAALAAVKKQYG